MKASKIVSLLITLGILGGAGYFAYAYFTSPGKITFLTANVTRGNVESAISATGTLSATLSVNVGSRVSGQVQQMLADYNTPVKKGQLLAVIDPATFQVELETREASLRSAKTQILSADVAERRANVDVSNAQLSIVNQKSSVQRSQSQVGEAKRQLDIQKNLADQGIASKDSVQKLQSSYDQSVLSLEGAEAQLQTSQANLESSKAQREVALSQKVSAEAQVKQAEAAVQTAQLNLEYTRILAPVDGIVIERKISAGDTVQSSMTTPQFFVIAQDLTSMHLDVNIDESDIARLKDDMEATFTVDAYPGQPFRGNIIQIRRAAVKESGVVTYTVVIDIANPDLRLFPGMTAQTRIVTDRSENALRIPSAALRFRPPDVLLDPSAKQKGGNKGGKDFTKDSGKDGGKDGKEVASDLKGFDPSQLKGDGKGFDPSQFQGRGGKGGGNRGGGKGGGGKGGGAGALRAGRSNVTVNQLQTIYVKNAKNLIEPLRVRTGISDGSWVVALGNNIEEGQEVLTGVEGIATPNKNKDQGFPFPGGNNQNKNFKNFF